MREACLEDGKVESKEDFHQLQGQCERLKIENELVKTNLNELIEQSRMLIQQSKNLLHERDQFYHEWQSSCAILTPR